jgi:oxygen-dependent protoporphyrinogen oxidase
VVGGGISGLTAAYRLSEAGYVVRLVEAGDRPGGVLRTGEARGMKLEWAANGFLDNVDDGAIDLANELNVPLQAATNEAKKRWVYTDGALHQVPMGPISLLSSPMLSWRGKVDAMLEPFRFNRGTGDETVHDFVTRRLGREIADVMIGPFVTGIFGGDSRNLSLKSAFPKLAALDAKGGLIRGAVKKKLADRRAGGRKRMGMMSPVDGVEALVRAVSSKIEDSLELHRRVVAIGTSDERATVTCEDGTSIESDIVVLATPAYVASALLRADSEPLAAALDEFPFVNIAVVHLGYERSAVEHALDGFGFLVREGEGLGILGCVFESVVWKNRAPDDQVLLRCMLGGTRDPDILELDDEAMVQRCRLDLDPMLGLGEPMMHHVTRRPQAIPQYTVGHSQRVEDAETLAQERRVVLAGNSYHGVSVNDCIRDARRVVDAVARLTAAVLLFALVACSGNNKRPAPTMVSSDGGDAGSEVVAKDPPRGNLEVKVSWLKPPAELVSSPGINECGAERSPAIEIHSSGGVRNAVVKASKWKGSDAPMTATLELSKCRIHPRVAALAGASGTIKITNLDERTHQVKVEKLDGDVASRVTTLPMSVVGQTFVVELATAGLYRLTPTLGNVDPAFVVVDAGAMVTDGKGVARFEGVFAGSQTLSVWHPPVQTGASLQGTSVADVKADQDSAVTVSLAP